MLRIDDKGAVDKLRLAAEGATPFEPNAFFERLIEMRRKSPRTFASMSTPALSSLAYYEAAKRKAAMLKDG